MNQKILSLLLLLITWNVSAQTPITLLEPANGATDVRLHPIFKWTGGSNSGAFQFQISKASDFSTDVSTAGFTGNSLDMVCSLLPSTQYFWRVRTWDNGPVYGDWSSTFTFASRDTVINLTTGLMWPPDKSEHDIHYPVNFRWTKNAGCQSVLELSKDPSMKHPVDFFYLTGIRSDTSYTYTGKLELNTTYYWRVCTIGPQGPWSPVYSFNIVDSVPQPAQPQPAQPAQPRLGSTTNQSQQALSFPNPFINFVTITFQLDSPGTVQFEIADSQGLKIDQFSKSFSENGRQSVEWSSKTAQPGNYFCKIVTGNKIEIVKLLLSQ